MTLALGETNRTRINAEIRRLSEQLPSNRLLPAEQVFCLNANLAGANGTSAQSIFGVGCAVAASTRYAFEIVATLIKSAGTTSHTIALGFGGTATLNAISFTILHNVAPVTATGGVDARIFFRESAASIGFTSAITTADNALRFTLTGSVSVDAAGTFNPQYTLSAAPGGAYSTQQGSFMRIWPLGASGSNISIGTWA